MCFVEGRIFRDLSLPEVEPSQRTHIYTNLFETLAKLHSIDPISIGLSSLLPSNKKDSYIQRQINAWWKSFHSSIVDPSDPTNHLMQQIRDYLVQNIPSSSDNR